MTHRNSIRPRHRSLRVRIAWLGSFGLALAACRANQPDIIDELRRAQLSNVLVVNHRGPETVAGDGGPARFVPVLLDSFDEDRAMETTAFTDRFYRTPGGDGFNAVLDRVRGELERAGFGTHPRLRVFEIETTLRASSMRSKDRIEALAWTPRSARLALHYPGGAEEVLHEFDSDEDVDRVMLSVYSPAADVEGQLVFNLDELEAGLILVTQTPLSRSILRRARSKGALGVVSSSLMPFNVDPTGEGRHLDAIQFRQLPCDVEVPVFQISARSYTQIRQAYSVDREVTLHLQADVSLEDRPLRTLVAIIDGVDRPGEAVALMSHVQEPGACDNASGVAGLLEGATSLAGLLRDGKVSWPSRTLAFIWGDEFRMTSAWLDTTDLTPIAGISSDMIGQSKKKTGAIALLERMPDPGSITTLPPDEHTPWGQKDVDRESLSPNGLAVIARCALADVAAVDANNSEWETAEHPWEGGSDHDVFIDRGVPAVLFWHFTDFAYHTSLDRLSHIDSTELKRTSVAILSTALAIADPETTDFDRYVRTLEKERVLRVAAAEEAGETQLVQDWETWCAEARHWLRRECFRNPELGR